jgi:hypothetical protein
MGRTESVKYLLSLQFNNLHETVVHKISRILSEAETTSTVEYYVEIIFKTFIRDNPSMSDGSSTLLQIEPDEGARLTVDYGVKKFSELVAPGVFANKYSPTNMIAQLYNVVNFNSYNSNAAAAMYLNLAANPNTPEAILKQFCSKQGALYWNPQIVEALASNVNVKLELLIDESFLKKIGSNAERIVSFIVSKHGFTKQDATKIIYSDHTEELIKAVMKTSYSSPEDETYVKLKFGNN